tara:strand:+ start:431 stop:829 length:399 start_codon:yes stop_codon:yes gene_type:complete
MDIYKRLPDDIRNRMFLYFRHPIMEFLIQYKREKMLEDIRDFNTSLEVFNTVVGLIQESFLLNILWRYIHLVGGGYRNFWLRMYRFDRLHIKNWIIRWYAIQPFNYQIRTIWGLLTKRERWDFLTNILGIEI